MLPAAALTSVVSWLDAQPPVTRASKSIVVYVAVRGDITCILSNGAHGAPYGARSYPLSLRERVGERGFN